MYFISVLRANVSVVLTRSSGQLILLVSEILGITRLDWSVLEGGKRRTEEKGRATRQNSDFEA